MSDTAVVGTKTRGLLDRAILALVGVLLVEVLIEAWLVNAFAEGDEPAGWPKVIKSALYIALFALTITKISLAKRWRDFTKNADIALVVLGIVMIIAGIAGGSEAKLIGEALFVYFRGVIVFYAIRAVRPSWEQVKPALWVVGAIVAANCVVAVVQLFAGTPAYSGLGWLDLKWAGQGRAQGLLEHPNDLGHVTGLTLLGIVAWIAVAEKVAVRWWAALAGVGFVLGIAQSRQSTIAVLAGVAVIALLRRGQWRRLIVAGLAVAALSALPVVVDSDRRGELAVRFEGLLRSIGVDVKERDRSCENDPACEESDGEIRVLFLKQGVQLWKHEPVLGYGVGRFGGIVAVKHDPEWNKDPRFVEVLGPSGFYMYKFEATSVDMFWLHLMVEAGAIGLVAYLVWMYLVGWRLARAAWQRGTESFRPRRDRAILLWSVATLVFAVLIAAWSPALEDPLFPPLMFSVLGYAWVVREGRD